MPRRLIALLPSALIAVLLPALPATAAGPPGRSVPDPVKTFTLVTGDVVQVTGTGAGQKVNVVHDAAPIGDVVVTRFNNDLYAVPTAVSPLLAQGRLDPKLFDLSELDRSGYDDATTPDLPLIATSASATTRRTLATAPSAGIASTHLLPAAGAVALTMDRAEREAFFAGFSTRTGTTYRSMTAGVTKLWLDAKVKATSDGESESNTLIGAGPVWQSGFDGTGQTIAVLDTGVDQHHPDLAGRIVAAKSFVPGDPDPLTDEHGHGTHVSSIALGTGAASAGKYAGTAKGAKLAIGKVLDDTGSGQTSWIIEAMAWAAQQAPTVNMSLGGEPTDGSDPLAAALDDISTRTGALFVTAAGNWGPGFGNPYPFTVATPASAARALAVGNGTHSFYLDASSSAGPRIGTLGLKPEIVAPGTDIVAARSADSKFFPLPDAPQYTELTGTSMAAPRVAGSVAVLRQQHPDWSADRIRDAITSTSCTTSCRGATGGTGPEANPQIYWRGAGGLDLQRASQQRVQGTGLLEFGVHSDPLPARPIVNKTIVYTNDGDTAVTLQLSHSLQRPDANFTYNVQPYADPPGLFEVPATVTVAPHATADVPVTVDLSKAPEGSVYGEIVATAGDVRVRTTLDWTRTTELHRLTIDYTGPDGEHDSTTRPTFGALIDLDTGMQRAVGFADGRGYTVDFAGAMTDRPLLPAHRYSLMVFQAEAAAGIYSAYVGAWTSAAVPDIALTADRDVRLDARTRKPWQVSTERPSVATGGRAIELSRTYTLGAGQQTTTFTATLTQPDFQLYSIPSTAPTTGSQQIRILEHREAPAVTVDVGGVSIQARRPQLANLTGAFPARQLARLYDADAGSPAELANARGRLVVIDEIVKTAGKALIDDVIGAATKAGASGVLVAVQDDGVAERIASKPPAIPVGVLTKAQAAALRKAIHAGRTVALVRSGFPSPYTYDLVHTKSGAIGTDTTVRVRDRELGVRHTSYHRLDSAGGYQTVGDIRGEFFGAYWTSTSLVPDQFERDELVTPRHEFSRSWNLLNEYAEFWNDAGALQRGQVLPTDVGSGTTVPSVGAQTQAINGKLILALGGTGYQGSRSAVSQSFFDGKATSAFAVNDDLCKGPAPSNCNLPGPGRYRLDYTASQGTMPLATKNSSSWTVNVTAGADSKPVPQPVVKWNWSAATGLDNTAPSHPYAVTVRPGYVAPYQSSNGRFAVQLQVTYDDGATWLPAGSRTVAPGGSAVFTVHPAKVSNGYVGYRISGTDQSGNSLDQWVLRAAHTS
ncbi:S8 family serine peptidase [Kribbella sp.]|uniref:S8 family serine peptidase n=1 Tax=Kribbella sp. TaxID=1871183 RepID=UPI002D32BBFC|nr:S8 family serine peptidase [Kribbella sp.]HZX07372.1 S8 family serine peptidase [Kribbella sp.]